MFLQMSKLRSVRRGGAEIEDVVAWNMLLPRESIVWLQSNEQADEPFELMPCQ